MDVTVVPVGPGALELLFIYTPDELKYSVPSPLKSIAPLGKPFDIVVVIESPIA